MSREKRDHPQKPGLGDDETVVTQAHVAQSLIERFGSDGTADFVATNLGVFGTLADLQADYPFGGYDFNFGGGTPAAESISYTENLFPSAIPAITAASFNGLQGMNPTNFFTVDFDGFTLICDILLARVEVLCSAIWLLAESSY